MVLLREATRIFNSKELAVFAGGDFSFLLKVAGRYKEFLGDEFKARDVFECCFKDFEKNYKNEYYFKSLLAKKILLGRHSLNSATMLNEFRVGLNKADCVILNGASTCYEIKSEYDSLVRLPEQLESYLNLFDNVYVVATDKHISKIEALAPESVGILNLSKRNTLTEHKPATRSDRPIDVETLMASLRKKEYLMVVKYVTGEVPKTSNGVSYDACKEILFKADPAAVRRAFCETLKKTRRVDKSFVENLPANLLVAGIEYCFSASSKLGLIDNLNTVFSKDTICTTQFSGENVMS